MVKLTRLNNECRFQEGGFSPLLINKKLGAHFICMYLSIYWNMNVLLKTYIRLASLDNDCRSFNKLSCCHSKKKSLEVTSF